MTQEIDLIEMKKSSNTEIGLSFIFSSIFILIFVIFTASDAINLISDNIDNNNYKFYGWLGLAITSNGILLAGLLFVVVGSIQNTIIKSHNLQVKKEHQIK